MAITYQAGRRIQGTAADRAEVPAISGGWKEVGRTTLGSANQEIDVTSLPDKRYYMVLLDSHGSSNTAGTIRVRYNDSTGTVYAGRWSENGGADGTYVNELSNFIGFHSEDTSPKFNVGYIANLPSKEKLTISHAVEQNTAGAGTAPNRSEESAKWVETTNSISSISYKVGATNTWNTNSEVVVLGYDPDDTHTDNFWEELASVELSSTASEIDSGTFTAKKYLWVQGFANAVSATDIVLEFNSDTGNNYARRNEADGGTDTTATSQSHADMGYGIGSNSHNKFFNSFIINNASNEKLMINHVMHSGGAGAGNAPARNQSVTKWANTSDQITQIKFQAIDSSGFGSGSILKVWGAD